MGNAEQKARLYGLLGNMYLCKPTPEALVQWKQFLTDDPLPGAERLLEALDGIDLDSEQELEDLLWEYTRLFIGPHRLPCPPFESVYTSSKRLLMQDAYDEVKQVYARAGVEMAGDEVMPDHIGAELNFLAILYDRIGSDPQKATVYEGLAAEFAAGHLQNWVPQFTVDMAEACDGGFYRMLAKVTREAVLGFSI